MATTKAQSSVKECPSCKREVESDSDFCPSCGHLFLRPAEARCRDHGTRPGVGVCVICSDPFCAECLKKVSGRFLCKDHRRVHIEQDWALAYESSDINNAKLAKAVLDEAGFDVVVRDFAPMGNIWDGAGDSSLSQTFLRKLAKVFVPIPQYLDALKAIEEWDEGEKSV